MNKNKNIIKSREMINYPFMKISENIHEINMNGGLLINENI